MILHLSLPLVLVIVMSTSSNAQIAFKPPVQIQKNWSSSGGFAADFDNDGKMDLASYSPTGITVLYGEGSHNFTTSTIDLDYGIGTDVRTMEVGDLNADSKADIAAFIYNPQNFYIALFISTGRDFSRRDIHVGDGNAILMQCMRIADLDKDGKADILGTNGIFGSMYFLKGDGTG